MTSLVMFSLLRYFVFCVGFFLHFKKKMLRRLGGLFVYCFCFVCLFYSLGFFVGFFAGAFCRGEINFVICMVCV